MTFQIHIKRIYFNFKDKIYYLDIDINGDKHMEWSEFT